MILYHCHRHVTGEKALPMLSHLILTNAKEVIFPPFFTDEENDSRK